MYRRLTLALWLVLLGLVRPVAAHPLPGSLVLLDFGQTSVQARLELPLDQLELAYGKSLSVDPAAAVAREHEALAAVAVVEAVVRRARAAAQADEQQHLVAGVRDAVDRLRQDAERAGEQRRQELGPRKNGARAH